MAVSKKTPVGKPRISIAKAQLQSAAGVELLALCQTVTEDGRLSREDIIALRDWLRANHDSDLPAIDFLKETVERIIADAVVTKEERHDLYEAIKKVLPPEARKRARKARTDLLASRRKHARIAKDLKRKAEREERERNNPLHIADFMVAGVHYEGRGDVIRSYLSDGDLVYLMRDRENQYSRNAIEIRLTNRMQIGFVPEEYAVDLAPYLDQGCQYYAYCKKILTGGRVPIPVVVARLYRSDASMDAVTRR